MPRNYCINESGDKRCNHECHELIKLQGNESTNEAIGSKIKTYVTVRSVTLGDILKYHFGVFGQVYIV